MSKKRPGSPSAPKKREVDWDAAIARIRAYLDTREAEVQAEAAKALPHPEYVCVGQVWEDRDTRRAGRRITVTAVDGEHAVCSSSTGGRPVRIHTDRFIPRKYRLVDIVEARSLIRE